MLEILKIKTNIICLPSTPAIHACINALNCIISVTKKAFAPIYHSLSKDLARLLIMQTTDSLSRDLLEYIRRVVMRINKKTANGSISDYNKILQYTNYKNLLQGNWTTHQCRHTAYHISKIAHWRTPNTILHR